MNTELKVLLLDTPEKCCGEKGIVTKYTGRRGISLLEMQNSSQRIGL